MAKARDFNVIIEQDSEGYFVATVPDLRGCHTQAKSLDTLMKRIREVIELCLEDERGHMGSPTLSEFNASGSDPWRDCRDSKEKNSSGSWRDSDLK